MKTLIISSSLSKLSKSYLLCKKVKDKLSSYNLEVEIFDCRTINLSPFPLAKSEGMLDLENKISLADNYIIAMGVHNYSINDSLKIILDRCFQNVEGKFFGIICAAGGEKKLSFDYASNSNLHERMENDSVTKNCLCITKRFY